MILAISRISTWAALRWHWWALATGLFLLALIEHGAHLDRFLSPPSDPLGYYQFLPGAFIEHDLFTMRWVYTTEQGQHISLFSIGVALMQSPFFLVGHSLAVLTDAPLTGYSWPYALLQLLGVATYVTAAFALMSSALRGRTSDLARFVSFAIVLLGTNLIHYTVREPTMSHAYSFFLFAWLWHLVTFHDGRWWLVRLSVCAVLILLVRPLNGVALLLPLLLRWRVMVHHLRFYGPLPAIIAALAFGLLMLPQLLYWHAMMGQWFLFTYGTKGEGFDWHSPHFTWVLFSYQNGWFIYSPLMFIAWSLLARKAWGKDVTALVVLLVWALLLYAYGSWWAWWLGAAYGFRGFIEISAWFIPFLAAGVDRARAWRPSQRWCALAGVSFLILVNLRLVSIYQAPWDGPDWSWGRLLEVLHRAVWFS